MNIDIQTQSIEILVPALENIQQYHTCFTKIMDLLLSTCAWKDQGTLALESHITQFISKGEGIVNDYTIALDEKVNRERTFSQDQALPSSKETKKVKTDKSEPKVEMEKTKRQKQIPSENTVAKYEKISGSQRDQLEKLILKTKKHETNIYEQKHASKKLKRNPQLCQIVLRFIYCQNNTSFYSWLQKNLKFIYCEKCDIWVRMLKANKLWKYHNRQFHEKQEQPFPSQTYSLKEMYEKFKSQIDLGQKVLYKCNCNPNVFKTESEYIKHITQEHNENPPPFSSHIFSNEILMENLEFNQYCVLEDILVDDLYYCGACDCFFFFSSDLYLKHIIDFHHGKIYHPFSSHYLNGEVQQKVREKNNNKKLKAPPSITGPSKTNLPKSPLCKKITASSKFSTYQRIKNNEDLIVPKQTVSSNPFEDQTKFIQIICNYTGPFICSRCNQDYSSYEKLKSHLDDNQGKYSLYENHTAYQTNFLKVIVKRGSNLTNYYLPVNANEKTKSVSLNVPIFDYRNKKIAKYVKMSYDEFLKFAEFRRRPFYCFNWWQKIEKNK